MIQIDASFTQANIKHEDEYFGKKLDANMAAGTCRSSNPLLTASLPPSCLRLTLIPNQSHNTIAAIPPGGTTCVRTIGATQWSILSRIDVFTTPGVSGSFFLKEYHDDNARAMVRSENVSIVALNAAIPANVPKPIAYGCGEVAVPARLAGDVRY